MKVSSLIFRIFAMSIALVVIQIVLGIFISTAVQPPKDAGPWFLLSCLMSASCLAVLAVRSDWRGWRLAVAMSAVPWIATMSNYLEGVIFLTSTQLNWTHEILRMTLLYLIAIPVWFLLFRKRNFAPHENYRPFASQSRGARIWKFAVGAIAYSILYFVAGTIIFPYIRDYYAHQTLPPPDKLFALQLFVRGPIYVGVCLLITRMLGMSRLAGTVAVATIFTVLNAIAPLIIPSGVFPDVVRWAHFCEMTGSNFLFGMLVAWMWGKGEPAAKLATQAA